VGFQKLATILESEIDTLAYPKAALFAFCVTLVAYNVLAVVKAALRAAHGCDKVEREVSLYYVTEQVRRTYTGMMIALPAEEWAPLVQMTNAEFARWLKGIARRVKLQRYRKSPRGPKKPRPRRTRFARAKHVSTARLLAEARSNK